jgi:hypothetical protein
LLDEERNVRESHQGNDNSKDDVQLVGYSALLPTLPDGQWFLLAAGITGLGGGLFYLIAGLVFSEKPLKSCGGFVGGFLRWGETAMILEIRSSRTQFCDRLAGWIWRFGSVQSRPLAYCWFFRIDIVFLRRVLGRTVMTSSWTNRELAMLLLTLGSIGFFGIGYWNMSSNANAPNFSRSEITDVTVGTVGWEASDQPTNLGKTGAFVWVKFKNAGADSSTENFSVRVKLVSGTPVTGRIEKVTPPGPLPRGVRHIDAPNPLINVAHGLIGQALITAIIDGVTPPGVN